MQFIDLIKMMQTINS